MKLQVITTNRADYYPLRYLIQQLSEDKDIKFIYESLSIYSINTIYNYCNIAIHNDTDIIIVHGDRAELLIVCLVALMKRVKIAHIGGGDISGCIDNKIRYAISAIADYHFVTSRDAYHNLRRLNYANIHYVGDPCYQNLNTGKSLDLKADALICIHPDTLLSEQENIKIIRNVLRAIPENYKTIWTSPNNDLELFFNNFVTPSNVTKFIITGEDTFLSILQNCTFCIGNSSAFITEAPYFKIPTILIGNRQKGRKPGRYTIKCSGESQKEIEKAIAKVQKIKIKNKLWSPNKLPYFKPRTAENIINILKDSLK